MGDPSPQEGSGWAVPHLCLDYPLSTLPSTTPFLLGSLFQLFSASSS